MADTCPAWAVELVEQCRVGHLATTSRGGDPHVVVCCFAVVDDRIYVPIDEKPKSGRQLTRVTNVRESGKAAIVFDRYDEDWRKLAWVQGQGVAQMLGPEGGVHTVVVERLRTRYPQYRAMSLERCELIEIAVRRWRWWRWE